MVVAVAVAVADGGGLKAAARGAPICSCNVQILSMLLGACKSMLQACQQPSFIQ